MENLVGYAKTDLIIPGADGSGGVAFTDPAAANIAAATWCVEVNTAPHSQTCEVPAEKLVIERELLATLPSLRPSIGRVLTRKVDRLSCVRFASARYSVPVRFIGEQVRHHVADDRSLVIIAGTAEGAVVAEHRLVAPGEVSILDAHYGGPRPAPRRAVRPRTVAEKAFCALGPTAEAFLSGAAAAGNTRLGPELTELNTLAAAHGEQLFLDALSRAVAFGRWRAAHLRSILAAGTGTPEPTPAGDALVLELPVVPVRPLSDYAITGTATNVVETLYRGLADNSVGRVIDTLLRNDLIICDEVGFAPLDDTGAQLLFRFVAAAYERRALALGEDEVSGEK